MHKPVVLGTLDGTILDLTPYRCWCIAARFSDKQEVNYTKRFTFRVFACVSSELFGGFCMREMMAVDLPRNIFVGSYQPKVVLVACPDLVLSYRVCAAEIRTHTVLLASLKVQRVFRDRPKILGR